MPDYLVQNGFWYKVAGGDAETPEYKVTVRSLPLFTDFQATYEYPKYLRRKNETATDHMITRYRGTTVTLVGTHQPRCPRRRHDHRAGQRARHRHGAYPANPIAFSSCSSSTEAASTSSPSPRPTASASPNRSSRTITVIADQAPQVVINKPEEEETTAPTNGHLAIDGKVGDDFGIDTDHAENEDRWRRANARCRRTPYLNGKAPSFRREKDDTWPDRPGLQGLGRSRDPEEGRGGACAGTVAGHGDRVLAGSNR